MMTIRKTPWRWIFLGLTLLWMGLIFGLSAAPARTSDMTSGRLVTFLQKLFFREWESLSEEDFIILIGRFTFFIRKAAHITEFAVLGALLSLVLMTFEKSFRFRFLVSFLTGLLYAASDEFHQLFVEGRSGSVFDVLVDAVGILIGCMFLLGISAMIAEDRRRKGKKLPKNQQNEPAEAGSQ